MAFAQLQPSFGEAGLLCVKRRRQPLRWLHASGLLLQLGRSQATSLTYVQGVASRRALQRQKLGQRLLELDVRGWLVPTISGSQFWTGVRWGGAGFIVAWWLKG